MAETASVRSEKKRQTRRQLLDAAAAVIAEKGFHNASLMEIAERAGVTTGAIYSNFQSKEALLAAVIQDMEPPLEVVPREGLQGKSVAEHLDEIALESARFPDRPESRRLALLQMELMQLELRDPALLATASAESTSNIGELAKMLEDLDDVPAPGAPPSRENVGLLLMATIQGLQQHRMLEPENVPDELFTWAVRVILHAARDYR